MTRTGPFWLAPAGTRTGGVNHLGLRRPGLYMADALMPGFTNTTSQARYYTVIAFIYAHARNTEHLRLIESAFVHAIRRHQHVDGKRPNHIGANSVPDAAGAKLPLTKPTHIASALDAPFYGPSARTLGIAGRTISGEHECSKLARDIAETISVRDSHLPRPGSKFVNPSGADALAPLCLCMQPIGEERDLLQLLFFRLERRRPNEVEHRIDGPRRRSLALLLHALEPEVPVSPRLLQRFLDSHLKRIDYRPPEALSEEAFGFAGLSLRWFFRHALETVWAAFGRMLLRDGPIGTDLAPYVDLTLSAAKGQGPWNPRKTMKVGTIQEGILGLSQREIECKDAIDYLIDDEPEKAVLAAAVQLAGIADVVQHFRGKERYYHRFASFGDPYWVSLSGFRQQADPGLSLRNWLAHLYSRYAIAQHFITGAIKWQNGINGYFFHPDDRGYVLDRPGLYWYPDPGRTKIESALSIMRGLGLVEEKDDSMYTTIRGHEVIQEVVNLKPH